MAAFVVDDHIVASHERRDEGVIGLKAAGEKQGPFTPEVVGRELLQFLVSAPMSAQEPRARCPDIKPLLEGLDRGPPERRMSGETQIIVGRQIDAGGQRQRPIAPQCFQLFQFRRKMVHRGHGRGTGSAAPGL